MKAKILILIVSTLSFVGCTPHSNPSNTIVGSTLNDQLYSKKGHEHHVQFQALFQSNARRVQDLDANQVSIAIRDVTPFLFGPLTYRELGGVQKGEQITPLLKKAYIKDGLVMVPYNYEATWMIEAANADATMTLPLPYSLKALSTPHWQTCTDNSEEDHRTWGFFWYFWDPSRPGCEHKLNAQYQEVVVHIGDETPQTKLSFPEYKNMIRMENGVPTLAMTFAFGYVVDVPNPDPFNDSDSGMDEFQDFYRKTKRQVSSMGFTETPIHLGEITRGDQVIGARFTGMIDGVQVRISIISNAGVDQMDIFAHSYANLHEGFFGWFGHSRVGSGFDANNFRRIVQSNPDQFSISPDYQLVYWAGCNSYSYYTLPFFEMKAKLDPQGDPRGTKKLDLISNSLPSLFSFNAPNANFLLQALLKWETPTSYQTIIDQIEDKASSWGSKVLVNVLGDEDNQPQ